VNSLSRMPPSLAETAPRQKPALLLPLYEFLLRTQLSEFLNGESRQICGHEGRRVLYTLKDDDLNQEIITCGRSLGTMAVNAGPSPIF
jgi:hypothetical protein